MHKLDLVIAAAAFLAGLVALLFALRSDNLVNAGGALGVVLLLDAALRVELSRHR